MENEINAAATTAILPDTKEYREFKAGVSWYVIWTLFISMFAGIAFLGLRNGQWKINFIPGGIFSYLAVIFFYDLLSRIPLCPWYRGPTLIVNRSGLKTEKWFIQWLDIEKISVFGGGRSFQIGIIKKEQRPWESPYLIEGPLGARMNDVVRYLHIRNSISTKH